MVIWEGYSVTWEDEPPFSPWRWLWIAVPALVLAACWLGVL